MSDFAPVTSVDNLRQHYGVPSRAASTKETPRINAAYRQLLEAAPFFALASIGPEGLDCSPRGDAANAVEIIDERTIAIPDRRGNNRLDTLENIVRDGRVALLFLIPGCDEALRINGTAIVTVDADLLASLAKERREPASAVIVTIQTMYFQCARAIRRAFAKASPFRPVLRISSIRYIVPCGGVTFICGKSFKISSASFRRRSNGAATEMHALDPNFSAYSAAS